MIHRTSSLAFLCACCAAAPAGAADEPSGEQVAPKRGAAAPRTTDPRAESLDAAYDGPPLLFKKEMHVVGYGGVGYANMLDALSSNSPAGYRAAATSGMCVSVAPATITELLTTMGSTLAAKSHGPAAASEIVIEST